VISVLLKKGEYDEALSIFTNVVGRLREHVKVHSQDEGNLVKEVRTLLGKAEEALKVFRDADVLVRRIMSREGNTPVNETRQVCVFEDIALPTRFSNNIRKRCPFRKRWSKRYGRWRNIQRREKGWRQGRESLG
jgi:hypothetical protein